MESDIRISKLENKINIMNNEFNKLKNNFMGQETGIKEINQNIHTILSILTQDIKLTTNIQKGSYNISINKFEFAKANDNLANMKNSFYRAAIKFQEESNTIENQILSSLGSEEDENEKEMIIKNKRGKYKNRKPLYYNIIIGKEFKLSCKNKNSKFK